MKVLKWREIKIQVINTRTENNKTFHSYNGNGISIEHGIIPTRYLMPTAVYNVISVAENCKSPQGIMVKYKRYQ